MMMAGAAPHLPLEAWIFILFCTGDNRTRGALRVLNRHVQGAGETARIAVAIMCARSDGGQQGGRPNAYFQRACWWTPWVGVNRIYAPDPSNMLARRRWACLARNYHVVPGFTIHYRDYIEVHMNSDSAIIHRSYYAYRWECRYLIYTGAV